MNIFSKFTATFLFASMILSVAGCDNVSNQNQIISGNNPTSAGEWTPIDKSDDQAITNGNLAPIPAPIAPPPFFNADYVSYESNGDSIAGWDWLRDRGLNHYAQWTITNLPTNLQELELDMEVLATNKVSGDRGYDAYFELDYCRNDSEISEDNGDIFRGETNQRGGDAEENGNKTPLPAGMCHQTVHLVNVSTSTDPVGYTCRGQVFIPASAIDSNGTLIIRAYRANSEDNHVAFKKESISNYFPAGNEGTHSGDLDENGNLIEGSDNSTANETELTIAELDSDGDGVINTNEELFGLNPNNPDTDGDGVTDNKDISGAIDPSEPTGWQDKQKKGMVRNEIDMLAWGMDGWVERYVKQYSIIPPRSWLNYLGTEENEGSKKSTMTEEYYKKAIDLAFSADKMIAYDFQDISPSDIGVDDTEKTNDYEHEHDYIYSASLLHPNEYRFYYDDITDYTHVSIKNSEEIKYPSEDQYFRYLLQPIKIYSHKENNFTLQFKDAQLYNDMYLLNENNYQQPGFIYSFYDNDNFDDDNNTPLDENLAIAWVIDNGVFETTITLPADKATIGGGFLKITPVWIKKQNNKVEYLPASVNWDLTGISRSVTFFNNDQGNMKTMTQELDNMDKLNTDWPAENFVSGQTTNPNYHFSSEWYANITKDPQATHPYSGYEATRTVMNFINLGLNVDNSVISMSESIELSRFNGIDDIDQLPDNHWARQPKYSQAVGAFALVAGVASISSDSYDAYIAVKNGEAVDVAYYSARATVTGISTASTMIGIANRTVGYTGKATKFAKLAGTKAAVGLAVAAGAVEVVYDSYQLSNANDPIEQKIYKEKIAADVLNTGLSVGAILAPHALAFQITWTVEAEIYAAIFGEDFAYQVASSPGSAAVFLTQYFITGGIPSQMATAAYEDARNDIFYQIETHMTGVGLPFMTIFIDPDLS